MRNSPMHPNRWQRIKPLLERALELEGGQERNAYLASLRGTDAELLPDLQRMLAERTANEEKFARRFGDALAPSSRMIAEDSEAQPEPDRVGEQVGHYRLLRLIGVGGMGSVYLAERTDGGFGQQVALKIIEGGRLRVEVLDRFEQEREILAKLHHPHIASLFDGGNTPQGLLYYTMEWVGGEDIASYCCEHLHTVEARVTLLLDVASALAYAHQNLVIHRDIKPTNILVTEGGYVKLLDFGIAKLVGTASGKAMTEAAVGPMTPEYAAPEQFRGKDVTVATDIFQFGTLCYRVLSGRLPYRAEPTDAYAWSRAVDEQEPVSLDRAITLGSQRGWNSKVPLQRLRRRLAGDMDAILRKALNKAPEQRYASMDAMIRDLQAFLDRRPVSARRAGPAYFMWRSIVRRPYVSVGAAVAIVALILTAVFALRQATIAHKEAERALHEADRADETSEFLTSLFKVSDPGVNRGEKLNANQILERGAERIDKEFADRSDLRAQLQITIGEVYLEMGDGQRAKPLLASAVGTLRATRDVNKLRLGHALRLRVTQSTVLPVI